MVAPDLSSQQLSIVQKPLDRNIFIEGSTGTGKTTCGIERMLHLMASGVTGNTILVLVPQRILGQAYIDALKTPGVIAGGMVTILTLGGMARRMVDLFWPILADEAGFSHPNEPPIFLTLETAQYYMSKVVDPLIQSGYFDSVTISRNRLYSQIIDNLNKAAVVGFPHTEIGERLISAWNGEPGQISIYEDAQECAKRFRFYCLENNLLDYSLQIEVFTKYFFREDLCLNYLRNNYNHIIADNIEEDVPVTHDLLRAWIPNLHSSLLIYDSNAGYRKFLGADPISAYSLKEICDENYEFTQSFIIPSDLVIFANQIGRQLNYDVDTDVDTIKPPDYGDAVNFIYQRYFPELLDEVSEIIRDLVINEGILPGEIAIVAPFLSDALRFSITNRLESNGIPVRTHRPSRSLREEPAAQCLLNLAAIAHPSWHITPIPSDVSNALLQAIEGLDPVRAHLLTQIVYQIKEGVGKLTSFDQIIPETQDRITYLIGENFEKLRLWLLEYSQQSYGELDHFISRLFGEILSQPGFGFYLDYDSGEVTANLVESIHKFRRAIHPHFHADDFMLGKEYFKLFQTGVIAAQYIESWQLRPENAVLVSPAYTFLMSNHAVEYQFWLDIGNRGWAERLYQPLTQPYVLSRNWSRNSIWTDNHEIETSFDILYRLIVGLINRCGRKIYLGLSEFNEQGFEQRGLLLRTLHRILLNLDNQV